MLEEKHAVTLKTRFESSQKRNKNKITQKDEKIQEISELSCFCFPSSGEFSFPHGEAATLEKDISGRRTARQEVRLSAGTEIRFPSRGTAMTFVPDKEKNLLTVQKGRLVEKLGQRPRLGHGE